MAENYGELDLSARYRVAGWPAVAVYIAGPVEEMVEVQWTEPCGDEDCECGGQPVHYLYDVEPGFAAHLALVVMVGDDRESTVDVSDLEPLDGRVCECGQIGCPW